MHLNPNSPNHGKWYDEDCSLKKRFLCGKTITNTTELGNGEEKATDCPDEVEKIFPKVHFHGGGWSLFQPYAVKSNFR